MMCLFSNVPNFGQITSLEEENFNFPLMLCCDLILYDVLQILQIHIDRQTDRRFNQEHSEQLIQGNDNSSQCV